MTLRFHRFTDWKWSNRKPTVISDAMECYGMLTGSLLDTELY